MRPIERILFILILVTASIAFYMIAVDKWGTTPRSQLQKTRVLDDHQVKPGSIVVKKNEYGRRMVTFRWQYKGQWIESTVLFSKLINWDNLEYSVRVRFNFDPEWIDEKTLWTYSFSASDQSLLQDRHLHEVVFFKN